MMDVVSRIRARLWWVLFASVVVCATWVRVIDLEKRPMHADEANQAVKLGALLERGEYQFDPRDHHGPTLYYFALIPAWVRQQRTLAELTEVTVRLTPAIFGVVVVALVVLAAAPLGRGAAWMAGVFAALAPAAVYFSRYFIQETLLVAFTLGAWVAAIRCWKTGRARWGLLTGMSVGLMQATKATAPVFVLAALIAWIAASWGRKRARDADAVIGETSETSVPIHSRPWRAAVAWGAVGFGAVFVTFYSSFFTHAAGLSDALATYGPMSGRVATQVSGHEKPWWYYGELFWWRRVGGYLWDQTLFLGLAVAGTVMAFVWRDRFARGVTLYLVFVSVALSATPYKTPWVVVHLIPPMAILAGWVLARASSWGGGRVRVPVVLTFVTTVVLLGGQVKKAVFQRPADPRNPFAYVHSSPDVQKVVALADRAGPGEIKVISEEYWPLPWYLRARPKVGYWQTVPAECDGVLVLSSVALAESVRAKLKHTYEEGYLGLRPGVVLVTFTRMP